MTQVVRRDRQRLTPSDLFHTRRGRLITATVAGLGLAAITLYVEASTEPFHVDEIRQTASYDGSLRWIIDASFGQEQPPLDSMFGAVVQVVLGVGDAIQRASSMLFGLFALVMLALLLWRRGYRTAAPVAVLTLAISPAFVSYTAYARPYALPLALMFGFAYGADLWLERRAISGALFLTVCALALPLTRVFEPPAFLGLAAVTLLLERRRWGGRIWWPIGAAAAALVLVEVPTYRRLSAALNKYSEAPSRSVSGEWNRLVHDTIPRLASDFPWPWLALIATVVAVALPEVRQQLRQLWWFAPLFGAAVAFALAFHVQAAPPQHFFSRYGYYWMAPFAVVIGLLVGWAATHWRSRRRASTAIAALVGLQAIVWSVALVADFGQPANTDYRALSVMIDDRLPLETPVVYDSFNVQVGSWRPGFYGAQRYLAPGRPVYTPENVLFNPEVADGSTAFVIALNGAPVSVEGWTAYPATADMTLYVSDSATFTGDELARSLAAFADQVPHRSALMRLAAASEFKFVSDLEAACEQYQLAITDNPSRVDAIAAILEGTTIADLSDLCG